MAFSAKFGSQIRRNSLIQRWRRWQLAHRGLFEQVQRVCLFVGHGRSGHSLIAALLNAHPQIVMADEIDSLQWVDKGCSRQQLYGYMLAQAEAYAGKKSRKGKALGKLHSYEVPGQWQGKFQQLRVIGEASLTTARLHNQPTLLAKLEAIVAVPVSFLQVVRNPYDGISRLCQLGTGDLEQAIAHYFWVCERVQLFRERLPAEQFYLLYHEQFLADGQGELAKLGQFVGVEMEEAYLAACAGILFTKPKQARHEISWSSSQIAQVAEQISKYPFLDGYGW